MAEVDGKKHTDIYLIRHGETDSNLNGILHGITDVPLNGKGRDQALLIASRMAELKHLDRIVSSPLQRALHTAQAIQRATGLPLVTNDGLREMNFGDAEGEAFDDLGTRYPDESYRFLDPMNLEARYPNGESRQEFFKRVESTLDEIATTYLGEDVVVVAHGGLIAAALSVIFRESANNWRERPIENTSLTHIEFATAGPVAHLVNDVVHLEQLDLAHESPRE